jgi:hypothetical protein
MSSTGLPALYIALALLSLICITLGPLIDEFNSVNKELSEDSNIPYSYERADTWSYIMIVWDTWPIWVFLGGIIGTIVIAASPRGGVA